jgi:hypothetical protein
VDEGERLELDTECGGDASAVDEAWLPTTRFDLGDESFGHLVAGGGGEVGLRHPPFLAPALQARREHCDLLLSRHASHLTSLTCVRQAPVRTRRNLKRHRNYTHVTTHAFVRDVRRRRNSYVCKARVMPDDQPVPTATLADIFKRLRGSTPQTEFGPRIGISGSMVAQVETGRRSVGIETLERIETLFELTKDQRRELRRARDEMSRQLASRTS